MSDSTPFITSNIHDIIDGSRRIHVPIQLTDFETAKGLIFANTKN